MKKYIFTVLFLLFLLIAFPVYPFSPAIQAVLSAGGAAGKVAYCTGTNTCTATTPEACDVLCEDFEGASNCDSDDSPDLDGNCRNSYVAVIGSGDSIDTTTIDDGPCAGTINTNVLQIAVSAASRITSLEKDLGEQKTTIRAQFWVKLVSESLGNGNNIDIFTACSASGCGTYGFTLGVLDTAGVLNFKYYYWGGAANEVITSSNITTGVWYRIQLYYTHTGNIEFLLDGASQGTDTHSGGSASRNPRYIYIGQEFSSSGTRAFTAQYDNFAVDDDLTGTQGSCP